MPTSLPTFFETASALLLTHARMQGYLPAETPADARHRYQVAALRGAMLNNPTLSWEVHAASCGIDLGALVSAAHGAALCKAQERAVAGAEVAPREDTSIAGEA